MANPIPSLDVDDDGVVKITSGGRWPAGTKEVMIGTTRTDADGAANTKLLSLVTDINGTPSEKASFDGAGSLTVAALSVTGATALTGALTLPSVVGTPGSGTGITTSVSSEVRHVVHKIVADYTAFQTAGLTKDVTLWTLPQNCRILRIVVDVVEEFSGGAISAVVMRVGKAANGAEYLVDKDVFTSAVTAGDAAAEIGASLLSATVADITWGSTQIVNVRMTSTTANLSELATGRLGMWIECCVYP